MEDENTKGNESLETKVNFKVEDGETVTVVTKEVEGKAVFVRNDYPDSKKDDVEWQKGAVNQINVIAQKNKANLEAKKIAADIKQNTIDMNVATKSLTDMGGSPSKDLKLDLDAGIMKELNLTTPEELAEADKSDVTRAAKKVRDAYATEVERSTKGAAMTKTMIDTVVNENEPAKVNEFIQYVKSLGVSATMQIYNTWKATQVKAAPAAQEASFDSLAGLQVSHVPFVPVGETHENLSGDEKIKKDTAEIMLGGLSEV